MRDTSARILVVLGLLAASCGGDPFDLQTESEPRALGLPPGPGPAPVQQVSPTDLSFNVVQIGSSATMTFTIRNVGPVGSVLQVAGMQIAGGGFSGALPGEFTIVQQGCTFPMEAGVSCQVSVRAAPVVTGPRLATLSFLSNDPVNFGFLTMNAIGSGALLQVSPTSIDFGPQLVGTTTLLPLTITNTGNLVLFIHDAQWITPAGGFGFLIGSCGAVFPGASCTAHVRFSPTAGGPQSASFRLNSNTAGASPTVSLTGSGFSPGRLEVSPNAVDFGNVLLGSSAARDLTFSNTGGSAIQVTDLAGNGDFSLAGGSCGPAPFPLAPGASCTVTVLFTPTTGGPQSLTMFFPTAGIQVSLFGTGVATADLQISMAGPAEAKVKRDITYSITITNAGPNPATNVVVSDALPDVTTFVSLVADGLTCTTPPPGENGTLVCEVASLAPGETRTLTVVARPFEGGKTTITNTAVVSSATSDPEGANNSASVETELKGKQ